jgi:hypothetical protein
MVPESVSTRSYLLEKHHAALVARTHVRRDAKAALLMSRSVARSGRGERNVSSSTCPRCLLPGEDGKCEGPGWRWRMRRTRRKGEAERADEK